MYNEAKVENIHPVDFLERDFSSEELKNNYKLLFDFLFKNIPPEELNNMDT
jgi:hypothetical protein